MTNPDSFNKDKITYNKSLDGLRGIAIFLVILWHYIACLLQPDSLIARLTRSLLASTWTGVDLFFVLSGFLLGRILLVNIDSKNYYSTFYMRRMLRIFPLYYLFLLIYFFISRVSPVFPQQIENSISYWKYICHIQNFFMGHSFGDPNLGVTWSLAIEEQFYLILPLLIRISRRTIKYIIVAGLIMTPVIRYLLGGNAAYVLLPARIDSLFFGVGIAYLFVTDQLNWFLNRTKLLLVFELLLLILMAILSITTDWNRTGGVWNHSIYAIFYSIIIILALQEKGSALQRIFNSPLLIYLGKVSYGLYLIHVPVLTVVFYLFTRQSPGLGCALDLLLVIMSFAICLFLLEISYRFYETPMRNLGRKFSY